MYIKILRGPFEGEIRYYFFINLQNKSTFVEF
jgi:hypothetical protein